MVKRMVATTFDTKQGKSGMLMISKRSNDGEAKLTGTMTKFFKDHVMKWAMKCLEDGDTEIG